jgi:hypothetical protein
MANLYELSEELRQELDSAFDPETGEMLPVFEDKRALWGSKARDLAAYILNVESDADQAKAAIERIRHNMLEPAQKKAAALKDYLARNMATCGMTEIKANDGSFVVKLYPNRDEAVELDEGATFPPELCNDPKPPLPSKSKIKAAILSGQDVQGAKIVLRDRLVIK